MRITKFGIRRYGPLKPCEFEFAGFNVIYGKNEEGKTLLVDALIRTLFRRSGKRVQQSTFPELEMRVQEKPTAEIEIEYIKDGRNVKLDSLDEVGNINLRDARNIFVIRDSDLQFDDATFANKSGYLEKFLNIELNLVDKLKNKMADDILGVTKNFNLKESSKSIVGKIDELLGKIEDAREEVTEYRDKIQELRELKDALQRNEYYRLLRKKYDDYLLHREVRELYEEYEGILEKLEGLSVGFTDAEYKKMVEAAKKIEENTREIAAVESEIAAAEEELRGLAERIEVLNREKRELTKYENTAEVRADIENLRTAGASLRARNRWLGILVVVGFLLIALGAFAPISRIFQFFTFIVGAVFEISGAVILWQWFNNKKRIEALKLKYGLSDRSISESEMLLELERNISAVQEITEKIDELRNQKAKKEGLLEEKRNYKERLEQELQKVRQFYDNVKRERKVSDVDEYQRKLKDFEALNSRRDSIQKELNQKLESADPVKWKSRIYELENQISDFSVDELPGDVKSKDLAELMKEHDILLEKYKSTGEYVQNVEHKLKDFQTTLSFIIESIETELSALRISPELLGIELKKRYVDYYNLDDTREYLQELREKCFEFRVKVGQATRDILEQIISEKKQSLVTLFSKETRASEYFRTLTGGRYVGIVFEPEEEEIYVERSSGEPLAAYSLSGGALDQLYFAIRLGLAEKLFLENPQPGFFILDDPFLKYDNERLERQMRMLKDLSDSGWQIIYFTAKDEVVKTVEGITREFKRYSAPGLVE